MRKKTIMVYKYEELSEKAKGKVRELYEEALCDPYLFEDDCKRELRYVFPDSSLTVQFSLNHCQGDGLNVYGALHFNDILLNLQEKFTEAERAMLEDIFDHTVNTYVLPINRPYSYCICDRHDYIEEIMEWLEDADWYINYENLPVEQTKELLEKFNRLTKEFMTDFCDRLEKQGYTDLYEYSEEDVIDFCKIGEYEFTKDGEIA